jgi:hypothetical protein
MSNPAAGLPTASRCDCDKRGISTPLVADDTSRIADGWGAVVPMPTALLCATAGREDNNATNATTGSNEFRFFIKKSFDLGVS